MAHGRNDKTHIVESTAGGHPEQEHTTFVVYNHETPRPQTRAHFKDEGGFHLPLKVEVRKGKADPTTVVFDRPNQQPES